MKRFLFALVALLTLATTSANAQSSPNLSYGQVPTAGQWNSYFASKQDLLNFTPLNLAGGTMRGKLNSAPATVNGAGFAILPGVAPTAPSNGDIWTTAAGFFAQVNGQTLTLINPASVAITGGTINGAVIGGTAPAAATFTTLAANGLTLGTPLPLAQGGCGATSALGCLTNLGLAGGTAGFTLTSNGPGTAPTFQPASPGTGALRYDISQNLTSGQQAQGRSNLALNSAGAVAFRNRLINGNFTINQRGAASASTAYGAGVYVMDRWKAGSAGVTLSFAAAANGDVTATITAGTLLQVMEGGLYLPEGGSYAASWSGTTTCRAYQGTATGSYVASPFAVSAWTAGTNGTLECGTGTLALAQFEPGTAATVFERRDDELRRAQRYYEAGNFQIAGNGYTATALVSTNIFYKATKRTNSPAVSAALPTFSNASGVNITSQGADGALFSTSAAAAGNVTGVGTYIAASEL